MRPLGLAGAVLTAQVRTLSGLRRSGNGKYAAAIEQVTSAYWHPCEGRGLDAKYSRTDGSQLSRRSLAFIVRTAEKKDAAGEKRKHDEAVEITADVSFLLLLFLLK